MKNSTPVVAAGATTQLDSTRKTLVLMGARKLIPISDSGELNGSSVNLREVIGESEAAAVLSSGFTDMKLGLCRPKYGDDGMPRAFVIGDWSYLLYDGRALNTRYVREQIS